MNKKWRKLWADAIATVLISLFCTVVGLGLVYIVCGVCLLLYKVFMGV